MNRWTSEVLAAVPTGVVWAGRTTPTGQTHLPPEHETALPHLGPRLWIPLLIAAGMAGQAARHVNAMLPTAALAVFGP